MHRKSVELNKHSQNNNLLAFLRSQNNQYTNKVVDWLAVEPWAVFVIAVRIVLLSLWLLSILWAASVFAEAL